MEGKTLVFKPVMQYKFDPNKTQTFEDVITISRNVTIYVNGEESLEALEHLFEKDDEE
ncbi:hypothetical protein [Bacillus anthracis]|uniref:hypothetical protein n=1 Tax=Bacillus anthracis TaxID=1392 RepID=UPI0013C2C7EF|nr:hypothetical protein [Bacillus anthracis]MEB9454767.1 hypothetical protein [Bacillus anthracis]